MRDQKIEWSRPLPLVWRRIHYYEDGLVDRAININNTAYTAFDTTYYRKTITLTEASYVRVYFYGYFDAVIADLWRNMVGFINYGTGGVSLVGAFGAGICYAFVAGNANPKFAQIACQGEKACAAGDHTFEIRARCWDTTANRTQFYNGSFAIDVCRQ